MIGKIGIIIKDIQTPDGMLYKKTKVRIREIKNQKDIRVTDMSGRIFWIKLHDILAS